MSFGFQKLAKRGNVRLPIKIWDWQKGGIQ